MTAREAAPEEAAGPAMVTAPAGAPLAAHPAGPALEPCAPAPQAPAAPAAMTAAPELPAPELPGPRPPVLPVVPAPAPVQLQALEGEGWRIIGASLRGSEHVCRGIERQDAFAAGVAAGMAFAVVCDGAGSARCAAAGAGRFSAAVLEALEHEARETADSKRRFSIARFHDVILEAVELCRVGIKAEGLALHEHHATLLVLAARRDATFIAHVGDGLAGVAPTADWREAGLSLPENGEYANETVFVTEDDWWERLRCSWWSPLPPGGVAVALTDGAMPFVIGRNQQGLEPEFMAPVSRYLFASGGMAAAEALAATLGSREACRISGDDKTLVWIGRLPG